MHEHPAGEIGEEVQSLAHISISAVSNGGARYRSLSIYVSLLANPTVH